MTTDHLPECETYRKEIGYVCICGELRACEQRVLEQNARAFDVAVIKHLLQEERAAALDAARDAVAAVPSQSESWSVSWVWKHDALAAIDALRGER